MLLTPTLVNDADNDPLFLAVRYGRLDETIKMLEEGRSVESHDSNHSTLLHKAATYGQLKIADFLLKAGANPNYQDNQGWTPLGCAYLFGYIKIINLLIAHGGDPYKYDLAIKRPIDRASVFLVEKLKRIDDGENIDDVDNHVYDNTDDFVPDININYDYESGEE